MGKKLKYQISLIRLSCNVQEFNDIPCIIEIVNPLAVLITLFSRITFLSGKESYLSRLKNKEFY